MVELDSRQTSHAIGLLGETIAKTWLRCRGYRIKAERVKTPVGEIDLVATKSGMVCFVEVKRYKTLDQAAWSITQRQKQRIVRAAQHWMQTEPAYFAMIQSFDAVLIYGRGPGLRIKHLPNAWTLDEIYLS